MAHNSYYEIGIAGSVDGGTTALLLQEQSTENINADEEIDIFLCGKCKKQFTHLNQFLNHKNGGCMQLVQACILSAGNLGSNPNSAFTSTIHPRQLQQKNVFNSASTMSLSQPISISDDMGSYGIMDSTISIQGSALTLGTNPFLSQVGPMTPRGSGALASFSQLASSNTLTPNANSAFTSPIPLASQGNVLVRSGSPDSMGGPSRNELLPIWQNNTGNSVYAIAKPTPNKPGKTVIRLFRINELLSSSGEKKSMSTDDGTCMISLSCVTGQEVMVHEMLEQRHGLGQLVDDVEEIDDCDSVHGQKKSSNQKKQKLQCPHCDKIFWKNFALSQHLRTHTGEKPYQCIVCGRSFAQKINVKRHMATHKVWPKLSTLDLPREEEEAEEEEEEEEEGENSSQLPTVLSDNSYKCQFCHEKFENYLQYKSHLPIHKDKQVYLCTVYDCRETFTDVEPFIEHLNHHQNSRTFTCHVCWATFNTLNEMGDHQQIHQPIYSTKATLNHKYSCEYCKRKFVSEAALRTHLSKDDHKWNCPSCDKVFVSEKRLRVHLTLHNVTLPYECADCHKRFKTLSYLRVHMVIHSEARPYKCAICGASFGRKDRLQRHRAIHSQERKFACPFAKHTGCTRTFSRIDKLKSHVLVHTGVKPHKCPKCNKSFTRISYLKEHLRIHDERFRYSCDKCGVGFLRKDSYERHQCGKTRKVLDTVVQGRSQGFQTGGRRPPSTIEKMAEQPRNVYRRGVGADETILQAKTDSSSVLSAKVQGNARSRKAPRKEQRTHGVR